MKHHLKYILPLVVIFLVACNGNKKAESISQKNELLFPRGDKNTTYNFEGDVWVKSLVDADSINQTAVGNVTFAPGARSKWHIHPAGQILLATDGVGYYQEKGKSKIILRKGDVVKCPPNIPHWHGASPDTAFVQVALTGREKGATVWLDAVGDDDYAERAARKKIL
ncbi:MULTISPECIES: cupin domain-containing protein [unclassified Pedobacter]|uniref:cupin domain-containing protein n=1 Tax=unclassified Pedobacter TaxID=2628915 RepID=UPI000B4B601F|nr:MULTISPECIES: cupin domain-containing protein [unclassified Pedobacter]MCX2585346.1 cupin domain-containing protein [Pedobacter sp. MR22-3]OWK71558.1 cupin [Pedobacter sp. AJM]